MRMNKIALLPLLVACCAAAAGNGALSLKLTVLTPSVKAGSQIGIRVTTTNETDHLITYHNTNLCNYSFKVLTGAGTPVSETKVKKALNCGGKVDVKITGRNIIVTLKPGESSSENIVLTELYNMSQPGKYSIQVDRKFPGIGHFSSNVASVDVKP